MKFQVRKCSPTDLEGEIIGLIEGATPYDAAVRASMTMFKNNNLPLRETGWPSEGGLFYTSHVKGETRVKDKPFYLRKV